MGNQSLADPQMNATPLIDVLLVLLVMLIFTLPIATHAVKLNLPHPIPGLPMPTQTVDIDFDGRLFWNGEHVADLAALEAELAAVGARSNQPQVRVAPDKHVRYEVVARVLAAAQRSGITHLTVN
jgi:biopolymer transport protein ExbD